MDRTSGEYYYIYDGLGSTRQLTNASGAVTDSYSYDAFGDLTSSPQATPNPYLFNGECMDGATGLYYLRARYMNSADGRFLSQDPFAGDDGNPVSRHRYLYASDDPANMTDPGGKEDGDLGEELEVMVDEDSLQGSTANVAFEAEGFVADMSAALNEGIPFSDLSSTETGQFFQWLGQTAEQFMDNALSECIPDDAIEEDVPQFSDEFGDSRLDRQIEYNGETLDIEAKYSLPRSSGSSLTRLVKQVSNSVLTSQGRTLLWTLAEPSVAQITLVTNALGDTAGSVDFVSGVQGLMDYVNAFFGL
jgi:RHS repeat-associated protein